MRRVRYGVGMSLDGFIADSDDGMSWMTGDRPTIRSRSLLPSTLLVGRRSYEVMLRYGARTYPGLRTYVFSRTLKPPTTPRSRWSPTTRRQSCRSCVLERARTSGFQGAASCF